MLRRYSTNPLDHEPPERLTFSDVTLLALLAVGVSAVSMVFVLGALCADHRITHALAAIF